MDDEYYTEDEAIDLVDDLEALVEYLYGWKDAIIDRDGQRHYKRKYVDMFVKR